MIGLIQTDRVLLRKIQSVFVEYVDLIHGRIWNKYWEF